MFIYVCMLIFMHICINVYMCMFIILCRHVYENPLTDPLILLVADKAEITLFKFEDVIVCDFGSSFRNTSICI